jgi:hypothetical protein
MSTRFIIDENYVITAVEIDGITHECSLQINSTWDPYLDGYVEDNGEIVCVMVGDKNNENNFVYDGTFSINGVDSEEDTGGITPAPEVNLVYMGTKYNYIKVWDGTVWLTDRSIGNKMYDTDNDGHLNYTINYLPISIQFVQVNEKDYSVMSESMVYTADHNGTWAIWDDGHWERLDNKPSEKVEEIDNGR